MTLQASKAKYQPGKLYQFRFTDADMQGAEPAVHRFNHSILDWVDGSSEDDLGGYQTQRNSTPIKSGDVAMVVKSIYVGLRKGNPKFPGRSGGEEVIEVPVMLFGTDLVIPTYQISILGPQLIHRVSS